MSNDGVRISVGSIVLPLFREQRVLAVEQPQSTLQSNEGPESMLINHGSLDGIFLGFKTLFNKGIADAPSQYKTCSMIVPSSNRSEKYAWLGAVAKIREWLGPRQITNLSASGYTITNKDFEQTIAVPRNDIEDDTFGVFGPMFEMMGRDVSLFPDQLVFALLAAGFTTNCYDDQFFFDTDHPVGMPGLVEPVSVSNMQTGSGPAWFLLDCSQPIKPLIYQERRPFALVKKDRPEDDNVFMDKEFIYGSDGRCNVGFGLWQLAFGSKGALDATNYTAARAAMQEFKSDAGKPLGIKPTHLFVPPALESDGLKLLNTEYLTAAVTNEWKGTAQLVVSPWLA
jgi:phage major head subunit gpT-like protein